MEPPSTTNLQGCALIGVKVTERYPLSEDERQLLLPSMRSWDTETLNECMCWEHDKLGLFGESPVFHEFRLMEDGSSLSFKPLFFCPDPDTAYCVVTNGNDCGVIMVYDQNSWCILAAVGVHNMLNRLEVKGFTSWDHLSTKHVETSAHGQHNDDSDLSDYWNQYGNSDAEDETQENAQGPSSKKVSIRTFIQSHCLHSIRDLYSLYATAGTSIDDYTNELFAIIAPNHRGHSFTSQSSSSSPLAQYTNKVVDNLHRLYLQVELDTEILVGDIEVALLELDFQVLNRINN